LINVNTPPKPAPAGVGRLAARGKRQKENKIIALRTSSPHRQLTTTTKTPLEVPAAVSSGKTERARALPHLNSKPHKERGFDRSNVCRGAEKHAAILNIAQAATARVFPPPCYQNGSSYGRNCKKKFT